MSEMGRKRHAAMSASDFVGSTNRSDQLPKGETGQ